MFIGPKYYVKHICVKVNLDIILEYQMKCDYMKACKSTQAKHMRGLILLPNPNIIEIQKNTWQSLQRIFSLLYLLFTLEHSLAMNKASSKTSKYKICNIYPTYAKLGLHSKI